MDTCLCLRRTLAARASVAAVELWNFWKGRLQTPLGKGKTYPGSKDQTWFHKTGISFPYQRCSRRRNRYGAFVILLVWRSDGTRIRSFRFQRTRNDGKPLQYIRLTGHLAQLVEQGLCRNQIAFAVRSDAGEPGTKISITIYNTLQNKSLCDLGLAVNFRLDTTLDTRNLAAEAELWVVVTQVLKLLLGEGKSRISPTAVSDLVLPHHPEIKDSAEDRTE